MTTTFEPDQYSVLLARAERATQPWLSQLGSDAVEEFRHLASSGELEMALESFLLSAMEVALTFDPEQKREFRELCVALDLHRDAVLSADFWDRASAYLSS